MANTNLVFTAGTNVTAIEAAVQEGSIKMTVWDAGGEPSEADAEIEGGATLADVQSALAGLGIFDGSLTYDPPAVESSVATLVPGSYVGCAPASTRPTCDDRPCLRFPVTF